MLTKNNVTINFLPITNDFNKIAEFFYCSSPRFNYCCQKTIILYLKSSMYGVKKYYAQNSYADQSYLSFKLSESIDIVMASRQE